MANSTLTSKPRSSNLELYRIVCMFLILSGHSVFNSGLLPEVWCSLSPKALFVYSYGIWGKTGINCFLMITGYFMCNSNITVRKYLKLWLEIIFYNIFIGGIFFLTDYQGYIFSDFINNMWPIHSITDGFVSCFLLFYLLIPFLNRLINAIDSKLHRNLIILLLFIYTVLSIIPNFQISFNYISWFSVIYLISAYIRRYPSKIYKNNNVKVWGGLAILSVLVSYLSVIFCIVLSRRGIEIRPFHFLIDSNAIFAVVTAFCSFMFFKNLRLPHIPIINTIGSTTFGILCIHANNDTIRYFIWNDIIDCRVMYNNPNFCLYIIIACVLLFFLCSILDWIRMNTVEKFFFVFLDKYIFTKNYDK